MDKESTYIYLYNLNKLISEKPDASQRDVSKALNLSLGMTNALLKKFSETGWVLMHKISARNIRYILTPDGMNELTRRSYHYIKRTMQSVASYKNIITHTVHESKKKGCTAVFLIEYSEIQFLIEYSCHAENIAFSCLSAQDFKQKAADIPTNTLVFFSETKDYDYIQQNNYPISSTCVDLMQVLGTQRASTL